MKSKDLSSKNDYLNDIIESLDQNVIVINKNTKVTIWNSKVEQLFFLKKNLSGKLLQDLFPRFWEEYRGEIWGETIKKYVFGKGEKKHIYRFPLKTYNKKIRYFDLKATPLKNQKGTIIGAILIMNDITENINIENQLVRKAKTSSLANLGASIAHEVRNPLNSISLNIQLVKECFKNPEISSEEEIIETIDNVLFEINRLDGLISYFLRFSKSPEPFLEPGDINDCTKHVLKLISELAKQENVKIIKNFGKLPLIPIDFKQLSQAIYNICINAIQAMQVQGGGALEITTMSTRDYIVLELKDDGPGIDEGKFEKLFDLFYTTKEGGSGLGLAISNQIIEKHNGQIVAENNLDRGACFSIYFSRFHKG